MVSGKRDLYLNLSLLPLLIFSYLIYFFFNVGILVYNLEIILTVIIKVMKMTIKHPKNSCQWSFQIPKKIAREQGIAGKERIICNRYRHQTQNPHTGKNMYASFSEILCPWKTSNTTRCKGFKGKLGAVQITCFAFFNTNRTQNSKEPPFAEGVFPCLFNFL